MYGSAYDRSFTAVSVTYIDMDTSHLDIYNRHACILLRI
jgi:hypothetical protein